MAAFRFISAPWLFCHIVTLKLSWLVEAPTEVYKFGCKPIGSGPATSAYVAVMAFSTFAL